MSEGVACKESKLQDAKGNRMLALGTSHQNRALRE